jgi:hypothetical protein
MGGAAREWEGGETWAERSRKRTRTAGCSGMDAVWRPAWGPRRRNRRRGDPSTEPIYRDRRAEDCKRGAFNGTFLSGPMESEDQAGIPAAKLVEEDGI